MNRSVVALELGLTATVHRDPFGLGLDGLAGLAVRDNPRRAHLVVSTVLAKHVPVRPSVALARAAQLAALITARRPVVLGFCETATGLGHAVADALDGADYVHTTRRPDPNRPTVAGFEEEHSHASSHTLQPPPGLIGSDRPLVLVDDELTTGTTALNTLAALPRHPSYVLAVLLDLRSESDRRAFSDRAREMGVEVEVVALLDGALDLPPDVLIRARPIQDRLRALPDDALEASTPTVRVHGPSWPDGVPTGGRHGFLATDRAAFDAAVVAVTPEVQGPVLVIGTEELMHLPVRLAAELERRGHDVVVQSTTRSPVLPWDVDGYAVRRRLSFASADDASRTSFLYNVTSPYRDIVIVTEDPADASMPLVQAVSPWATGTVHVVVVP